MGKPDFNKNKKTRKSLPNDIRVPPQNLDAERGVLGSVLLMNEAIDEIGDYLRPEHFYNDAHQRMYSAIRDLYEKGIRGIDSVTLLEELNVRDELETVGGIPYITQVLSSVPHAAHARYYADIVRDKFVQRSLIYACTEILQDAYEATDDTDALLNLAEQKVFRILEEQETNTSIEMKDILIAAFDRINERLLNDKEVTGLSTGFTDLDHTTTGFQPAELIILAARPSMGKTALVCNIAEGVCRHENKGVLVFSLEQSRLELAERFLCISAKINGHNLRAGNLSHDERDRMMAASSDLSGLPMYIDDQPGKTVPQMGALARRIHRKSPLGLIIIDYLQLIEPEDKGVPREQQIAQITRRIKFLCKELDVPTIALAQLNRGVELREDKRPKLADLRESGAIEQDADLVMFLHRPDAYDPEDRPGEAEVVIAKHRSGPTGIVRLVWRKEFMRFENYTSSANPDFPISGEGGGF
jgi:replicative DNA helicase